VTFFEAFPCELGLITSPLFLIIFLPQVEVVDRWAQVKSSFEIGCQLKLFFQSKSMTIYMLFSGVIRDADFIYDTAIGVASIAAAFYRF
jgi:hypothetical protein